MFMYLKCFILDLYYKYRKYVSILNFEEDMRISTFL